MLECVLKEVYMYVMEVRLTYLRSKADRYIRSKVL